MAALNADKAAAYRGALTLPVQQPVQVSRCQPGRAGVSTYRERPHGR